MPLLTFIYVIAETALSKVNPEAMALVYQINAVGPLLVMKVRIFLLL